MRRTNQRLPMPFATLWTALVLTASFLSAQDRSHWQDRNQARSMVISRYGIVATESPSPLKPARILEHGGNAVDAAIAANAMMGLVAPMSNGIGGDLFAIVYDAKSGKLYGLNASGWAPKGLTIEFLNAKGFATMPTRHLFRHRARRRRWLGEASRPLRQTLDSRRPRSCDPIAGDGFPVTELIAELWRANADFLRANRLPPRPIFPIIAPPDVGRDLPQSRSRATLSS